MRQAHSISAALLAAVLALGLSACGDDEAEARAACEKTFEQYTDAFKDSYAEGEYETARKDFVELCVENPEAVDQAEEGMAGAYEEAQEGMQDMYAPVYDQQQLIDYLGLIEGGIEGENVIYGEWTYTAADGTKCAISTLYLNASEVAYDEGLPTQVTTPEGNAGVAVQGTNEGTCVELLRPAIAEFEPAMAEQ